MIRSHRRQDWLPHAAKATEAAAPEATEAPTRRIAGTPTHGYAATREAGMSVISLNVRFQGQPGPHLLAVSFSQFDPNPVIRRTDRPEGGWGARTPHGRRHHY